MTFQEVVDPRGRYPNAKYSFDTNVFIDIKYWYPKDVFIVVWKELTNLVQQGVILATYTVKEEIDRQRDELFQYINQFPNLFVEPTPREQEIVRQLVNHERLDKWGKGDSEHIADSYVVALAAAHNLTVVTHENYELRNKVPTACEILGIEYINFQEVLRREEIKFE